MTEKHTATVNKYFNPRLETLKAAWAKLPIPEKEKIRPPRRIGARQAATMAEFLMSGLEVAHRATADADELATYEAFEKMRNVLMDFMK